MKYETIRRFLKNGYDESSEEDVTYRTHDTFSNAYKYCQRYSKGLRFLSVAIEDENGDLLYELMNDGKEYWYVDKDEVGW